MFIYYAIKMINQNFKNPTNKRKLIIRYHLVYINIYMFKIILKGIKKISNAYILTP